MLSRYIERQLHRAVYKVLDDQTYFGEIPGIPGVWAQADQLEACRDELREVLEGWIILKLKHGETIPELEPHGDSKKEYA